MLFIPDEAVLKVDIRPYSPDVLTKAVNAFKRIVAAECQASGVSGEANIKEIEDVPPLVSSPKIVKALSSQFETFFGPLMEEMKLDTASDDFSILAPKGVPYALWNFGSTDPKTWEDAR